MPTSTGGQALVQQLKMEGFDTIFCLPGIQLDWAFDAIYAERGHFRVIHTRHEQACAYMADGYARASGKPGLALVVPGPGVLNATAALSTAYACSSPVLMVTGQIHSDLIGKNKGILHEIPEQMRALASVTKWQSLALDSTKVPGMVHEAMSRMLAGRPRPVEVEIPPDVLQNAGEMTLFETAAAVQETVVRELGSKRVYPNVDYYAGIVYHLMGMPMDTFTSTFAVARTVGWTAQVLEYGEDNRIMRPLDWYVGPREAVYVPLDRRK